jgi:hypothetical protein
MQKTNGINSNDFVRCVNTYNLKCVFLLKRTELILCKEVNILMTISPALHSLTAKKKKAIPATGRGCP